MRHPKSTIQLLQIFRHFLLTLTPPPRPTTNFTTTLTTTKEELHCSLNTQESGANNRHHSTVRSICHFTHILTSLLNASLFATLVPYFNCCYNLVSACLLFRFYRRPFALSQSVRHQSEHLYTVPVFLLYVYQKTTDDVYSNLSHLYTTSLGNVVEFGVPFVCWFCDDDFWGCTSHTSRYNTVSHIFNSCVHPCVFPYHVL